MKKGRLPRIMAGISLILALVALLPACGPQATVAPTVAPTAALPEAPATIKIGTVTDQTGPLTAFGVQTKWGLQQSGGRHQR
jgi:hypothetical protein